MYILLLCLCLEITSSISGMIGPNTDNSDVIPFLYQ